MFKYIGLLIVYIPFFIFAMLSAPILPLFAEMRNGPADNNHTQAVEPRLPNWLFWFDTSTDNSLWGDYGWRTIHCPKYWNTYWGMVLWLWRNPACGFAWSVLAHRLTTGEEFSYTSSGCGLHLDKNRDAKGWFLVRSSEGAFQYRWVRSAFGKQFSLELGWLLDVYINEPALRETRLRAAFQAQPAMRTPPQAE